MTSGYPASSMPQPQHPATAAQSLAEAAQAAARAWGEPLAPARHRRTVSQLYSTLRDLGIAARGLSRYHTIGTSPGANPGFAWLVAESARRLLGARDSLSGVLAAEGISPPAEPGAALCQAARNAILAWRQPSGTSADRDITITRLLTTIRFLSAATHGLATYAPHRRAIDLQAVRTNLTEVTACLAAAIPVPTDGGAPGRDWHTEGRE